MKKEIIKLKRTEPLTDYEKNFPNYNPKLHKVGWVTWIGKGSYDSAVRLAGQEGEIDKHLHPEDGKYWMNFSVSKFKVIE